jgi:C-terminal processing protease CtpA/Prc
MKRQLRIQPPLAVLINYFKDTKGLIIDIRGNGGGDSENGDIMESRLLKTKTLVEYIYYKNGPGHNDFTSPQKLYISPKGNAQYTKPIAVLINRDCFSSASFFASRMSVLPHVSLIGDTTSGGAGRPKYFDLPNGWVVRYSSNYALRPDGFDFENGVPPNLWVELKDSDKVKGKDTIIEYAISWINSH